MKTTIPCVGCDCKKTKKKSKLLIAALLFPWSALAVPALWCADKIAHAFGMCIGL